MSPNTPPSRHRAWSFFRAVVPLLCVACGDAAREEAANISTTASAPTVIDVSAGDYFYTMADTITAGAVTLQLATVGQELHHLQLIRLADGKTMEDLFVEMQGEVPPAWAELVGGPNAPIPNATTSRVTLQLDAGTYVALCIIPSPDGVLHVAKGMSKAVVVRPGDHGAPLPTPTAKMTLVDYDFVLDAPLTAGAHVIEVNTAMGQPHEVVIVRLNPGVSVSQFASWVESMAGPPPGAPMGGTVGLAHGRTNYVHVDLEPGEYGLMCFFPDAKDGRPHVAHGMLKQITVM